MGLRFFRMFSKHCLGIDIGTSSIKIVELSSQKREGIKLENYGEINVTSLYEEPFRIFSGDTLSLSEEKIFQEIKNIFEKAKISIRRSILTLPDFTSFFTNFELPPLTPEELPEAVRFEARQHIPLPLSKVTLDWSLIEGEISDRPRTKLKVLITAVPNEIINQYLKIINLCGLRPAFLETEVFSLARSLTKKKKGVYLLIDIGAKSTSISIVEDEVLKRAHSFDVSGKELTQALAKNLNIDYDKAENLKKKHGCLEKKIADILYPIIDSILAEIGKISQDFYQTEGKDIDQIILAGGSALIPGLKDYFFNQIRREVVIADPFSGIVCHQLLEKTLKQMGPSYAIAVGAALRGLEQ